MKPQVKAARSPRGGRALQQAGARDFSRAFPRDKHGSQLKLLAGKLFGRMTDALAATGDEGRGKPR